MQPEEDADNKRQVDLTVQVVKTEDEFTMITRVKKNILHSKFIVGKKLQLLSILFFH